jgi:hypothetical protein
MALLTLHASVSQPKLFHRQGAALHNNTSHSNHYHLQSCTTRLLRFTLTTNCKVPHTPNHKDLCHTLCCCYDNRYHRIRHAALALTLTSNRIGNSARVSICFTCGVVLCFLLLAILSHSCKARSHSLLSFLSMRLFFSPSCCCGAVGAACQS